MTCPICGGAEWRARFVAVDMYEGETSPIVSCAGCGVWRTDDGRGADDLASLYSYASGTDAGRRRPPIVDRLLGLAQLARVRQVASCRTEPGRVLDVGCGSGAFLGELRRRGWDVLGVEIDDSVAATAAARLGAERVVAGRFETVALPSEPFDVVTFWHTLEHFADPLAPLLRARQLLAPGGSILVGVPNIDSWQARLSGRDWLHLDVPRHRWHFSPETLRALAGRASLELAGVEHFSLEYGPFGLFQSALAKLGLGHALYTRLLGPGRDGGGRLQLWAHVPFALPHAGLAAGSLPLEMLAAARRKGGAIVARLTAS
jgi:SAM-dependent methyltransferase